jgi:hypothetical protein
VALAGIIRGRFWQQESLLLVLLGGVASASLIAFAVLCIGLFQPLVDRFAFRQTQTALTAFWLMRGGPILAYETPVVGFPWSIPYEFPLYQIIVAALSRGVPLDAAGRIVSFAFFVGCLWPLRVLFRALRFDALVFPCVSILFLLSPLYLFWGRTFMIETCALFFSLVWLAYFAKYLHEPKGAFAAVALVAGSLGILAKPTTFPAFSVLGGLLFLKEFRAAGEVRDTGGKVRLLVIALLLVSVPFALGMLWTAYADMVKVENEIGARLTSRALVPFNFGRWDQRVGMTLWRDVILHRSLMDAFGYAAIPAVALVGASLFCRRHAYATAAAVVAFIIPFLMFTNLHIVHSYYQSANALFMLAAAGMGIACVMSSGQAVLGLTSLAVIVAGQLVYLRSVYAPLLTEELTTMPQYRIAQIARSSTSPDDRLIIVGDDWSSTIPYYAQRKSLAIPKWVAATFLRRAFSAPEQFLDGGRVGGIVYCTEALPKVEESKALVEAFIAGRTVLGEAGPCRLLAP